MKVIISLLGRPVRGMENFVRYFFHCFDLCDDALISKNQKGAAGVPAAWTVVASVGAYQRAYRQGGEFISGYPQFKARYGKSCGHARAALRPGGEWGGRTICETSQRAVYWDGRHSQDRTSGDRRDLAGEALRDCQWLHRGIWPGRCKRSAIYYQKSTGETWVRSAQYAKSRIKIFWSDRDRKRGGARPAYGHAANGSVPEDAFCLR